MGDDARQQCGDLQEVMLHETAIAWLRHRLKVSLPARPWLETRAEFAARLKEQAQYVNENYNVEGLCKGFPARIEAVFARNGDRLPE